MDDFEFEYIGDDEALVKKVQILMKILPQEVSESIVMAKK